MMAFLVRGKGVDVGVDAAPTETTSDNITKPPPPVTLQDHTIPRQRNDGNCLYQKVCSELEWVVTRAFVVRRKGVDVGVNAAPIATSQTCHQTSTSRQRTRSHYTEAEER